MKRYHSESSAGRFFLRTETLHLLGPLQFEALL